MDNIAGWIYLLVFAQALNTAPLKQQAPEQGADPVKELTAPVVAPDTVKTEPSKLLMNVHSYTQRPEPAKRRILVFDSYSAYRKWQDNKQKLRDRKQRNKSGSL